jgi:FMN phosphatase YigB (HAD superfamily)
MFDNVWSCDDFNTTKADPEIYKMAAARLGVSVGDVIFVDDNYNAVKTATNAGAMAVGIFDESSREYIDEFRVMADRYVMDFSELLDLE